MADRQDRLHLIAGILFIFRILIFITLFFFPIHLKNTGFSGWEIGILMGVDSLMSLFTTLPLGVSNDLIASRRLIVLAFVLLGGTYFMLADATRFFVFMVLFMLLGSCNTLAQISMKSLIYKTTETSRKGGRFSIVGFAEHSGIAVGACIGGILLMGLSYARIFTITGVLFLMIAPLILFLPKTMTHIFDPATYKKELFQREVIIFTLITFLYTYHWGAEKTVYTLFLRDALSFTQTEIGVLIGVTVMVLAVSCLLCGKLLDMKLASMARLIVIGLSMSAAGNILLALATSKAQAYMFRTVHEIGDAAFVMFSYVMTSNLFSRARVGGGSGFISQIGVLGTCTGALTSGMLLQQFGPRLPMIAAGVLSFAALCCFKKLRLATTTALEHTQEQYYAPEPAFTVHDGKRNSKKS